jgi:hypothetical protein
MSYLNYSWKFCNEIRLWIWKLYATSETILIKDNSVCVLIVIKNFLCPSHPISISCAGLYTVMNVVWLIFQTNKLFCGSVECLPREFPCHKIFSLSIGLRVLLNWEEDINLFLFSPSVCHQYYRHWSLWKSMWASVLTLISVL